MNTVVTYVLWQVIMSYTLWSGESFVAKSQPMARAQCEALLSEWQRRSEFNPTVRHANGRCTQTSAPT